jgi:hypothetical protein
LTADLIGIKEASSSTGMILGVGAPCRNEADLFGNLGAVADAAEGEDAAPEIAGQRPYDLGL